MLQALASSGGKKLLTGNIEFLRFNDDGTKKFDSFRYDSNAPLNSRKNPILMDGDVINVEKTVLGKATTIFGEISNPVVTGLVFTKYLVLKLNIMENSSNPMENQMVNFLKKCLNILLIEEINNLPNINCINN